MENWTLGEKCQNLAARNTNRGSCAGTERSTAMSTGVVANSGTSQVDSDFQRRSATVFRVARWQGRDPGRPVHFRSGSFPASGCLAGRSEKVAEVVRTDGPKLSSKAWSPEAGNWKSSLRGKPSSAEVVGSAEARHRHSRLTPGVQARRFPTHSCQRPAPARLRSPRNELGWGSPSRCRVLPTPPPPQRGG